jgi:hypothetical protein
MIPTVIVSELYWGMVSTTTGERQKQKQATGSQGAAANTIDDEEVENMKVKKLISGALALGLAMSMGLTAFAATSGARTDAAFEKLYKSEGDTAVSPAENFELTTGGCVKVLQAGGGATTETAPKLSIASASFGIGEATATGDNADWKFTFDKNFPNVGIYVYSLTETDGKTAGVTYDTATKYLYVTVVNGDTAGTYKVASYAVRTSQVENVTDVSTKISNITNTYKAGSLTVSKKVTGNLGDKSAYFTVNVIFTAPTDTTVESAISVTGGSKSYSVTIASTDWKNGTVTKEIQVKDGDTVTFKNIPAGVTYKVVETAVDTYTASYTNGEGTIDTTQIDAKIVNNKNSEVDTGINLDSLPYIMMLAIAGVGLVVFAAKKRGMRED